MGIDEIIQKQGWNNDSVLSLLWAYLETTDQMEHVIAFFQHEADEENAECASYDDCDECGRSIPSDVGNLVNEHHSEDCSLHPSNSV